MPRTQEHHLDHLVSKSAIPLNQEPWDFTPLLSRLTGKTFVMLGEATHGTHEFYEARAEITKRLIIDHGLNAIAIEGDWPCAYRVNQYVRWENFDQNADVALSDFKRFPLWMWRNTVVLEFVEWLREHNKELPPQRQVGFYGLDMYSMYESINAVIDYLYEVDSELAMEARIRYGCLDHVTSEQSYGRGVASGRRPSCEDEVVQQLVAMHERSTANAQTGDWESADDQFQAEQNARLVHSAEKYYRHMFDDRADLWNLRDKHMIETLHSLHQHLSSRLNRPAKISVWEHNSHLGDARATYMGRMGQFNVGQLARERYGDDCALIGFTTYTGTVTAASDWDGPAERKRVQPGQKNSVEDLFHRAGIKNFLLPLEGEIAEPLRQRRLERAIGVIYRPETERVSHYFDCRLADQFDAVVHYDETRALEPLDPTSEWIEGDQETYPFGV